MKSCFARNASTALNWADETDRVLISHNLRANIEILGREILMSASSVDRRDMLGDLARCHTRLAVCDMDVARKVRRCIKGEAQRDTICRITLEKMADMVEEPCSGDDMALLYLDMAQRYARAIKHEKLDGWFSTGPYSGLGRLALTISDLDLGKALREREALPELVKMARMIPLTQGVDEEKIESQIFRDGLQLFRRHQGLEKYPYER